MSTVQPPASTAEALGMLRAALGHLASVDATELTAAEQAHCLRMLEQSDAVAVAARASVLGAFSTGQGYHADGACSPRVWLMHQTSITRGAAASHVAWARRFPAHPQVAAALTAGELSESFGRTLCSWVEKMPAECRDKTEEVLVAAVLSGLGLRDLAALAGEILDRARPVSLPGRGGKDDSTGHDEGFEDRGPPAGDHIPGRGRAARRPDAGLCRAGRGGAGCPVGPRGAGGHPDPGPALPRCPRGSDAQAGGQ